MNRLTRLLIPTMLGVALVAPLGVSAQHRGSNRTSQSSRTTSGTRGAGNSSTRPGGTRTGSGSDRQVQPTHTKGGSRPGGSVKNQGTNSRPATSVASGEQRRPGNQGTSRPQSGSRPGNNKGNKNNHNGNHGNHKGNGSGLVSPGFRPGGNSAPRPGSQAKVSRPHYNYRKPGYRPPRPGGGYWDAPKPSPYRINYWVPPVPRYVSVVRTVPTIGTVLGLAFGSFIDAGINALYSAGYTVSGYYNDAVYLSNVRQLGYVWPEAIVRYDDGLMCGTQFYSWSAVPDQSMYYSLYNQLTASYGAAVDITYSNSGPTATWWGGGNTGYITLSYGYGPSATGLSNYYTSLTYTAY